MQPWFDLGPLDQQLFGASSTDQNPGQTADGKHLQVGSLWKLAQNKHYKFHQISLNMEVGKNRKKRPGVNEWHPLTFSSLTPNRMMEKPSSESATEIQ